ncbi:MAG: hypothetical protein ABI315_08420 [Bacteroidia bacterium]
MNFINQIKRIPLFYPAALVLLLTVTLYYTNCSYDQFYNLFNSDALQIPSIYKDVFIDHNGIRGWCLSTSPFFFPDMFFYFLFYFIFGSFVKATLLYGLFQLFFISFLFHRIMKEINPSLLISTTAISSVLLTLFFFCNIYLHYDEYSFLLVISNYHVGTFNLALLSTLILMKLRKENKTSFLIFLLLCLFLGEISDRLFLVMFYIPAIITSTLFFLLERKVKQYRLKFIKLFLVFAFALIAGEYMHSFIENSGIVRYPPSTLTNFDYLKQKLIGPEISAFFLNTSRAYMEILLEGTVRTLLIFLITVSFLLSIIVFFKCIRQYKSSKKVDILFYYNTFSIAWFVIALIAPFSHWHLVPEGEWLRYYFSAYILALLNLPVWIFYSFRAYFSEKKMYYISSVVLLLLFILVSKKLYKEGIDKMIARSNFYPTDVMELDNLAEKNGLKYGVADFWKSKPITMFSKKRLRVYAVYSDLCPYDILANYNWFYKSIEDKQKAPIFNFVIVTTLPDTTHVNKLFPNPLLKFNNQQLNLWKVPEFYYTMGSCALLLKDKKE